MTNKEARQILIIRYGKRCMLCGRRPRTSHKRKGKLYLTYHHIKPLSENGETSPENGAVLCNECHEYLHHTSEKERRMLNKQLLQYKATHEK